MIDPITGAPAPLEPPAYLDSIPLLSKPTPIEDIGGVSPIRRTLAYPDDILPTVSTLAYGQQSQESRAAMYSLDTVPGHDQPVPSLYVHDTASSGGGGGPTPAGFTYQWLDQVGSILPSNQVFYGSFGTQSHYCYGMSATWHMSEDNTTYPLLVNLSIGLSNDVINWMLPLIRGTVYIASSTSPEPRAGHASVWFPVPIDLYASNLNEPQYGTFVTYVQSGNGDVLVNANAFFSIT